jgi:hypothetical protein
MSEKKSLYTETESYSLDAQSLDLETEKVLRPIIEKWMENGYSLREISHVMAKSVHGLECEISVFNRLKLKR